MYSFLHKVSGRVALLNRRYTLQLKCTYPPNRVYIKVFNAVASLGTPNCTIYLFLFWKHAPNPLTSACLSHVPYDTSRSASKVKKMHAIFESCVLMLYFFNVACNFSKVNF